MRTIKSLGVNKYYPEVTKFFQINHVEQGPYFFAISIPFAFILLLLVMYTLRLVYAILRVCCCNSSSAKLAATKVKPNEKNN